ncbi:hypothetical protein MSPP1_003644 [Malassezia sp. CBS 17886]|nr:hypothetical protein MSPP1_003644 [Malassezia sp. CBS 17886]
MGFVVLDLEEPYSLPRFFAHRTAWEVADIQWNPHPARAEWVASTSNQKLLIWNLSRPSPAACRAPAVYAVPTAARHIGMPAPSARSSTLRRPPKEAPVPNVSPQKGSAPHAGARTRVIHPAPPTYARHTDAASAKEAEYMLDAHMRAITDINWSPFHPEIVASSSVDTWARVWDLRMGGHAPRRPVQGYSAWNASMTQVKWNRVTPHRLACSCDNKVLVFDDRYGALPYATVHAHHSKIYGLNWSPDAHLGLEHMMTCSLDGTIKYWDFAAPASRAAMAERRPVCEAENTIETVQPVWRARYLPFGRGAVSIAQRGDTAASMWAYDEAQEPVKRFVGHTDLVKEFLFRVRGGADAQCDDRELQLITWSRDQTLRMWPIGDGLLQTLGHVPGAPLRLPAGPRRDARRGACGGASPDGAPGGTAPITVPRCNSHRAGTWPSPTSSTPPSAGSDSSQRPTSHARSQSLPDGASAVAHVGAPPQSLPAPRRHARAAAPPCASADAGPQMHYQSVLETRGPATFADPVRWMARVQMQGAPPRRAAGSDGDAASESPLLDVAADTAVPSDCGKLTQEVAHMSRRFPGVFESIDIGRQRCTVAVSGRWHDDSGEDDLLRVYFHFPLAYPYTPPVVEVEKNASIPVPVRAEVHRALLDIVEDCAPQNEPSLERCIVYLAGHARARPDLDWHARAHPGLDWHALHGAQRKMLHAPCGASFGPGDTLVSFSQVPCAPAHVLAGCEGTQVSAYRNVVSSVVDLTLRASDAARTQLLDLDIVQLMSTNMLGRRVSVGAHR